ncbi:MAG: hypothetical protein WKG01_01865 [Kofleriaceae bacterium]
MTELTYVQTPGLRTRPLASQGYLIVFDPERPMLRWLNCTAWVVFELCTGITENQIKMDYGTVVAPSSPEDVAQHVRAALNQLVSGGLIRAQPKEVSAS